VVAAAVLLVLLLVLEPMVVLVVVVVIYLHTLLAVMAQQAAIKVAQVIPQVTLEEAVDQAHLGATLLVVRLVLVVQVRLPLLRELL
jgi:hypothetical protein